MFVPVYFIERILRQFISRFILNMARVSMEWSPYLRFALLSIFCSTFFKCAHLFFCDTTTTSNPWNGSDIYELRYQSSSSHYARSCNDCISLTSDNKISAVCKDGRLVNSQVIYVFGVSFSVAQYEGISISLAIVILRHRGSWFCHRYCDILVNREGD